MLLFSFAMFRYFGSFFCWKRSKDKNLKKTYSQSRGENYRKTSLVRSKDKKNDFVTIEILSCHGNERSHEIALRWHNLIALLSSSRTVRGNFQGRKCRIIDKNQGTNPLNWQGNEEVPRKIQELLLVEGKSTEKEHGDGTLVPTSDVTCSNE